MTDCVMCVRTQCVCSQDYHYQIKTVVLRTVPKARCLLALMHSPESNPCIYNVLALCLPRYIVHKPGFLLSPGFGAWLVEYSFSSNMQYTCNELSGNITYRNG